MQEYAIACFTGTTAGSKVSFFVVGDAMRWFVVIVRGENLVSTSPQESVVFELGLARPSLSNAPKKVAKRDSFLNCFVTPDSG